MTRLTRREAILGMAAATLAAPFKVLAQPPLFPKGAIIRTLFKDYSPEALAGGATLFHEHLSFAPDFMARWFAAARATLANQGIPAPAWLRSAPPPEPAMRDVGLMAEELRSAQHEGVACIVDASLEGMGMKLDFIREAAKKSGLPVVKGAGYYTEPFYPKEIATMSEEQITHALIRQADEYPAGAFGELGSWDEITAIERKVFRAVGRAHLATNLPIFTHTGIPGKSALEQLDILEDAGVDPRRVAIGHLGNPGDAQIYLQKTICRRGAYIGLDRQSQGGFSDDPVVPQVMALIEAGFTEHLLFSGDASSSYAKPLTVFLPKLRAAGVSDETLHRITVDNPRRFLAFVPKRPRTPVSA
jgi:phosphotriesterase-related protein